MDKKIRQKCAINEIDPLLEKKADNIEVSSALNNITNALENRPTNDDIIQVLNDKLDKKDFVYYYNSKPSIEDFNNNVMQLNDLQKQFEIFQENMNEKIETLSKANIDINNLQKILDNKANLSDVVGALDLKADVENVDSCINEINTILENKINKNEFLELSKNIVLTKDLNEILKKKAEVCDFKILNDAFQDMKTNLGKKVDDIDDDLDRLIDNIKSQFQSMGDLIENLEKNKVNFEQMDKFNEELGNKTDENKFNIIFESFKKSIFDTMNNFKNENLNDVKNIEKKLYDNMNNITNECQSVFNEINLQSDTMNNLLNEKEKEITNIANKCEAQYEQLIQDVKNDLNLLNIDINKKLKFKLDLESFQKFVDNNKKELNDKVNVTTIKKNNEELLNIFVEKLNNLYTTIQNDTKLLLGKKADISMLDSKISTDDLKKLREYINKIDIELKQKVDTENLNSILESINADFENIHMELNSKTSDNDLEQILNTKVDIKNFDDALKNIKIELETKLSSDDFSNAMNNQAMINDTLCNENCLARWIWKSGKVKNSYTIPWEEQSVNTAPDNFIWEKDKTFIVVSEGGLYMLSIGFYTNKKPNIQILVNGEIAISVNGSNICGPYSNSSGYSIYQNSARKIKKVTGLSMIDFILLPNNAKIAVTFIGEEGFGFMGLKKL